MISFNENSDCFYGRYFIAEKGGTRSQFPKESRASKTSIKVYVFKTFAHILIDMSSIF